MARAAGREQRERERERDRERERGILAAGYYQEPMI